jgi:hypothetical protein
LLDLDLPQREALAFLEAIRGDRSLRCSLVLGLALSCQREVAVLALGMGLIGCIPKRIIHEHFARVLAILNAYRHVLFPPDLR